MIKFYLIITGFVIIISCKSKTNSFENCLDFSLKEKLSKFEKQLIDSLQKRRFDNYKDLFNELKRNNKIQINDIHFDKSEINNLKNCVTNFPFSLMTDSSKISKTTRSGQIPDEIENEIFYSSEKPNYKFIYLFYAYHYIDKSIICANFYIENDSSIYLNGEQIKNLDSLVYHLKKIKNQNISHFDRCVIAIEASKEDVKMGTIERVEAALREVDFLRINYSTIKQP